MFERFLFSKVEMWIVLLILMLCVPTVVLFGWAVQYKAVGGEGGGVVGGLILRIAHLPDPVFKILQGQIQPQGIEFRKFAGLRISDPTFRETGTMLVSSYSAEHGVSTAFLYDLQTRKVLHEWIPPVEQILAQTTYHDEGNIKLNYRTQHPVLLENGDIVFTSGEGPLVRMTACGKLVWTVDRHFHHSINRSRDGHLFVPIVIGPTAASSTAASPMVSPMRNDGFAEVSLDGKILQEWSLADILERHGFLGLLYGVGPYEEDRFHLNDVEPIWRTDDYVRAGDLVLSIRHLSTVLLYRPATDAIVWLQTGPWLNQHDVDYLGDGIFTIFGNDSVRGDASRPSLRGYNTIWQYDQKSGRASERLPLKHVGIFTKSEGLHRVLENGDIFIEETDRGLIHRVSGDGMRLRWSYAHGIGDGRIGALHWSRYFTHDEATFPWLRDLDCKS
jgi:Arylsulfotransferase (ASST)